MDIIKVISATELSAENRKKIEASFSKKHKTVPQFQYSVNETLIGGVLVIDNETYYDATVKGQLTKLKSMF